MDFIPFDPHASAEHTVAGNQHTLDGVGNTLVAGAIRASVEEDNPLEETKAGTIHNEEVGTATVISGFVGKGLKAKDASSIGCFNDVDIDLELR